MLLIKLEQNGTFFLKKKIKQKKCEAFNLHIPSKMKSIITKVKMQSKECLSPNRFININRQ